MKSTEAVQALGALAQDKRLAIYRLLVEQGAAGMAAGDIAAKLDIAAATLSFHLKELEHAGLVSARPQSRFIFYSADFRTMNELIGFLTKNCCGGDPAACFAQPLGAAAKVDSKKRVVKQAATRRA